MQSGAFAQVERLTAPDGTDFALKTVLRSAATLTGRAPPSDAALCAADAAREASLLRSMAHVNVVRCLDSVTPPCSLALEWCDTDVAKLLRSGPLCQAAAKALYDDLLRALAACEENGLLHLDIKPANLLVGQDGRLKLADFGSACTVTAAQPGGTAGGTRWYRAPELLLGAAACEGADRWAAGALLPELLTGAPLLPGSTDLEQLARITALLGPPDECESATLPKLPGFSLSSTTQRASLREALPDADADALALCLRLLRWVPSDRLRPVEALAHRWFFSLPLPYTRRQVVELCNDGKS